MKTKWLDRRIAAPGPWLALCLNEAEFKAAIKPFKLSSNPAWKPKTGTACVTHFDNPFRSGLVCIISIDQWDGRDPIEVAGPLVHEAVHVWQLYCDRIGEDSPGDEQEAYGIQSIAQELMAEFSRRQSSNA